MALKKRGSALSERERSEAIEAFGDAAEPQLAAVKAATVEKSGPPVVRPRATPGRADGRSKPDARTMLLRFDDDPALMQLLVEVAQLEGRMKHPMALRALRIGLEQVRDSYDG
ncbi:hypothetical protein [Arthrobacter woluwensis]|uniref:Uncharacterized protein n=1 Tax=Arthrobacter woluwensis TaxID=156980 RepID=A0A1H4I8H7_9MICC|nr:hypothetical protein [Arthrobacter woluwensis]SEB29582.1 hypothetical protein SAMN04489745_0062 [Arthrobacter woluwensis]